MILPVQEAATGLMRAIGSGTILDAMRLDVPLVVVPNEDLLHNHQTELAKELARQQYLVHGKLKYASREPH
jgi:beta-1,4-N-acetylglucosaminyltransferase